MELTTLLLHGQEAGTDASPPPPASAQRRASSSGRSQPAGSHHAHPLHSHWPPVVWRCARPSTAARSLASSSRSPSAIPPPSTLADADAPSACGGLPSVRRRVGWPRPTCPQTPKLKTRSPLWLVHHHRQCGAQTSHSAPSILPLPPGHQSSPPIRSAARTLGPEPSAEAATQGRVREQKKKKKPGSLDRTERGVGVAHAMLQQKQGRPARAETRPCRGAGAACSSPARFRRTRPLSPPPKK